VQREDSSRGRRVAVLAIRPLGALRGRTCWRNPWAAGAARGGDVGRPASGRRRWAAPIRCRQEVWNPSAWIPGLEVEARQRRRALPAGDSYTVVCGRRGAERARMGAVSRRVAHLFIRTGAGPVKLGLKLRQIAEIGVTLAARLSSVRYPLAPLVTSSLWLS
jgi:hypothetical protein